MPVKLSLLFFGALALAAACGGTATTQGGGKPSPAVAAAAGGAQPGAAGAVGQGVSGKDAAADKDAPTNASFPCTTATSGGASGGGSQLTAARVGRHPGFDRMTFEFDSAAVPAYTLRSLASADFVRDPSGQPLKLDGSAGLLVTFPRSSGVDLSGASPRQTYTGSLDINAGMPTLRELAEVGDFERVMSWGAGLNSAPCVRISELTRPARLALDVRTAALPSSAELASVAERIYHPIPGGYSAGCENQTWENRSLCPITARFVARLKEEAAKPASIDLFCRCQNGDPAIHQVSVEPRPDGGVAHVTTGFSHVDLLITRVDGKLLADDVRCPGGAPETSIYASPMTPCS